MSSPLGRRGALHLLIIATVLLGTPPAAQADWYLTPFVGVKFGGETTLIDQERVAGSLGADSARKWVWGMTGTWIGAGILGFEGDVAFVPGYFEADSFEVLSSRVTTVTVNVVVAAPLDVTRDSLRPYASGGYGLMRATTEHVPTSASLDYSRNLSSFNVGGGVIGMLSRRTGVRWDVRYQRGTGSAEGGDTIGGRSARLSFWRGSMGVVIRY